ncbi:MAG TPA: hypothetical protein VK386_00335 [Acidimicrobiales bacterium]|nr:hypothetical protein [Acidimicrobiales bacterium]
MHHHGSALALLTVFLGVVILGTAWRLLAAHLAVSNSGTARQVGRAMAFQY